MQGSADGAAAPAFVGLEQRPHTLCAAGHTAAAAAARGGGEPRTGLAGFVLFSFGRIQEDSDFRGSQRTGLNANMISPQGTSCPSSPPLSSFSRFRRLLSRLLLSS